MAPHKTDVCKRHYTQNFSCFYLAWHRRISWRSPFHFCQWLRCCQYRTFWKPRSTCPQVFWLLSNQLPKQTLWSPSNHCYRYPKFCVNVLSIDLLQVHKTDPQSRLVVITISHMSFVRPRSQYRAKQSKYYCRPDGGLAKWIIALFQVALNLTNTHLKTKFESASAFLVSLPKNCENWLRKIPPFGKSCENPD